MNRKTTVESSSNPTMRREDSNKNSLSAKSSTTNTSNAVSGKSTSDKRSLTQAEKLRAFNLEMAMREGASKDQSRAKRSENREPVPKQAKEVKKELVRPSSIATEMFEINSSSSGYHGAYASAYHYQGFKLTGEQMNFQPTTRRQSLQSTASRQSTYPSLSGQGTQQDADRNMRKSFNQKRNSQSTTNVVPVVNKSTVKMKQVKAAHRQSNTDQKVIGDSYGGCPSGGDFEEKCYEIEELYARRMSIRSNKSVGKRWDEWD
ncbi:hypothetical protein BGZ80_005641 [Entomortierella chlamydospora]|uniref:Uncharacterized protein n=1 Tax=Entomortierella chlamydospora TaxID=101097 RepID=A0A9P6T222_9FUNG|nr:hypothetical protein BGZ79_001935 [Entomortierella chlamydospora]KAG0019540.1 hypothetical protein BGZ80_005641 [Entomortierella chlamydospora]